MLPSYTNIIKDAVLNIHAHGSIPDKKMLIVNFYDYTDDQKDKLYKFTEFNNILKPCWLICAYRLYNDTNNVKLNYVPLDIRSKVINISLELIKMDKSFDELSNRS